MYDSTHTYTGAEIRGGLNSQQKMEANNNI